MAPVVRGADGEPETRRRGCWRCLGQGPARFARRGAAAESGPAFFDADVEDRVRKLQTAYGIKADGIVGPETLFALSALDDSGPRLARTVQ